MVPKKKEAAPASGKITRKRKTRDSFASDADWFEYRANRLDKRASYLREQAKIARQFPDPETRKKRTKLLRLRRQLAEIEAELGS